VAEEDSEVVTASEFAFLAIGLVLGVASGAALIEVLRARPPSAREVRVTVAPNAIQGRLSSTLAEPHGGDPGAPARGGPGDRRWRDETIASGEPAATGRRMDDRWTGQGAADSPARTGTPVREPPAAVPDPVPTPGPARPSTPQRQQPPPLWLRPAAVGLGPGMVAVPMSTNEPDPITMALRSTAAASAVAAMAASRTVASSPATMGATTTMAEAESIPDPTPAAATGSPSVASDGTAPSPADPAGPADPGPCAEERRVADERCEVATRAREGATAAADSLRRAQRTYDDLVARAETASATADPRAVRTAKEQAQQRFRSARSRAATRDDIEAGAREWLAEINRINHDTREAALGAERDRAAAAALGPQVERLAVEADAARITAERADEACVAAREAVAACDEARVLEGAAARATMVADADEPAVAEAEPADAGDRPPRIAAATPEPEDEFAFSTPMHSQAGQDAVIIRILRGDRDAMQRAVARLAGDDAEAHRRWQTLLGNLAEALIARSIDAVAFDFPVEHFFWGPFSQSQNRDIAAGLSSLGFRFDGFGGWVDDRVPSQRDLSLAVGYAGLDPMRVRHWPNETEMNDLLREVRVAADEYVAGAAGGLTLGELVSMLGRRADGLTELWNEWGSVRPILLEAG
jgi:hypothetical protein